MNEVLSWHQEVPVGCWIVRMKETQEAVGIYYAMTLDELRWLVDEVTDPADCEYATFPSGGIVWPEGRAKSIPLKDVDWQEELTPVLQLIGPVEPSEMWFLALISELKFKPLVF